MTDRGTKRGAGAPFYAPLRRKTSAEIISEARAAIYGEMSGASGGPGGGALRPLRTRRPFTPREPQRTLFTERARKKDTRPPSAFDLKNLSLSESEDAFLEGAALTEDVLNGMLLAESQNNAKKKPVLRNQHRSVQDRSGDCWGGFPKLPHLSGRSKPLHRRNTIGQTEDTKDYDLAHAISITQPLGSHGDESISADTNNSKSLEVEMKRKQFAGVKAVSCDNGTNGVFGDIAVKHIAVQLPNASTDYYENMGILELAEELSLRGCNDDHTLLMTDILMKIILTNCPTNSLRDLLLRALYMHIDSEDARVQVAIARVMLTMRVTGSHLAAACKLVFKIARNDKNDHFFRNSNLLELLVEGCGRADPLTEGECCVYGAGALRFLALDPRLCALAHRAGALHLAALHLKILNNAKAENPRSVSEQSTHALYQLTGALRNLAGAAPRDVRAFVASGALGELLGTMLHFTDRDVLTNVARCLSVLSAEESCCAWLCASATSARALLRVLAACAARAPLAVRLAYTLGNMAAADEQARINVSRALLRVLAACAARAPLAVRLAYTLGNMAAADEQARINVSRALLRVLAACAARAPLAVRLAYTLGNMAAADEQARINVSRALLRVLAACAARAPLAVRLAYTLGNMAAADEQARINVSRALLRVLAACAARAPLAVRLAYTLGNMAAADEQARINVSRALLRVLAACAARAPLAVRLAYTLGNMAAADEQARINVSRALLRVLAACAARAPLAVRLAYTLGNMAAADEQARINVSRALLRVLAACAARAPLAVRLAYTLGNMAAADEQARINVSRALLRVLAACAARAPLAVRLAYTLGNMAAADEQARINVSRALLRVLAACAARAPLAVRLAYTLGNMAAADEQARINVSRALLRVLAACAARAPLAVRLAYTLGNMAAADEQARINVSRALLRVLAACAARAPLAVRLAYTLGNMAAADEQARINVSRALLRVLAACAARAPLAVRLAYTLGNMAAADEQARINVSRALLRVLAACAARAPLAVRLAYTLGNMAAADEQARINVSRALLRVLAACAARAPLAVRLAYTLGNMAAADEQARINVSRALLRVLAACAARAPLAVRLAYTLGNMAAADEQARINVSRALLRVLAACAARAPLAVRLAYTLGNMAAADEQARINIYNEDGSIDVLLTILESYTSRQDNEPKDLESDPDLHLVGSDLGGSDGSNENVLIKTVRVVANLCLAERAGRGLAFNHAERTVKALLACLDLAEKSAHHLPSDLVMEDYASWMERREELATAALATLNNITFYREPPDPPETLDETLDLLCKVTCRWLNGNGAAACEAVRALGNLTRTTRAAQLIVLQGALDHMVPFLQHDEPSVRCAAAGVLVNVCGAGVESAAAARLGARALTAAAGAGDAPAAALLARALWNAHAHAPLSAGDAHVAARALSTFIDDDTVFAACEATRGGERRASDPDLYKHHVKFDLDNNNSADKEFKPKFVKAFSVDQNLHLDAEESRQDEDAGWSGEDLGFEEGEVEEECDCGPCRRLAAWEELVGVAIPLLEKLTPLRADASVGTD